MSLILVRVHYETLYKVYDKNIDVTLIILLTSITQVFIFNRELYINMEYQHFPICDNCGFKHQDGDNLSEEELMIKVSAIEEQMYIKHVNEGTKEGTTVLIKEEYIQLIRSELLKKMFEQIMLEKLNETFNQNDFDSIKIVAVSLDDLPFNDDFF